MTTAPSQPVRLSFMTAYQVLFIMAEVPARLGLIGNRWLSQGLTALVTR